MRKITLFIVFIGLSIAACSKDSEVRSFIAEFEIVTKEMTKKIESGDVDGAKKVFEKKRESLKSSFDSFKNAREIQVSEDVRKELEESVKSNIMSLSSAATKAAISSGGDASKAMEIQQLLKAYAGIFQM